MTSGKPEEFSLLPFSIDLTLIRIRCHQELGGGADLGARALNNLIAIKDQEGGKMPLDMGYKVYRNHNSFFQQLRFGFFPDTRSQKGEVEPSRLDALRYPRK